MADELGTTGGQATAGTADAMTKAAEMARKPKARDLNELIRYTMWSVFRVTDRAALESGGLAGASGLERAPVGHPEYRPHRVADQLVEIAGLRLEGRLKLGGRLKFVSHGTIVGHDGHRTAPASPAGGRVARNASTWPAAARAVATQAGMPTPS